VPFGIGIGQVVALVREVHALESSSAYIAVSGTRADELAAALSDGGDATAVVIGADPAGAAVVVRLLEGDPSAADNELHRRIVRAGTPLIVLRPGAAPVPYALPGDVLDLGPELPVAALARAIAAAAPDAAPRLASRLPVLRPAVERRVVALTAFGNAVLAFSNKATGPQLPLLSIAQSRMLLMLDACRGEVLPRDAQGVATVAAPRVAASVGLGYAARTLVRSLPVQGRAVRAGVAYAGTRALGEARLRLP
jgi:hypothetical protein